MKSWAVIVGIDQYGGQLAQLHGAVADAADFAEWALHPDGGDVAPERLYFWTHPAPANADPALAAHLARQRPNWSLVIGGWGPADQARAPHAVEIVRTAQDVGTQAHDDAEDQDDKEVRRIYVFFAGHGVRAKEVGNATEQTCFVAGDFGNNLANNVQGLVPCESFRKALLTDRFDEAVFFLDCCRLEAPRLQTTATPITDFSTEPADATWGVGNAAQDGKPAFETENAPVRGAFSMTLMEALRTCRGGAASALHMEDLRLFVTKNIRQHTTRGQVPSVLYGPNEPPGPLIVAGPAIGGAPAAPPKPGPLVDASAVPAGTELILRDGDLAPIATAQPLIAGAGPIQLPPLADGLYSIEVSGSPERSQLFKQPGAAIVHVP